MSRLPELSSTVPSLIVAPCPRTIAGNPVTASAPVEPRKLRRVTLIVVLLSLEGLVRYPAPRSGAGPDAFLFRALLRLVLRLSFHRLDRRRKIHADRIADAFQRRQLQRH